MNSADPKIRDSEMAASPLESFGGQKISNETYARARELRRWLAEHPKSRSADIPQAFRGYVMFLLKRKLITCEGRPPRYSVRPV